VPVCIGVPELLRELLLLSESPEPLLRLREDLFDLLEGFTVLLSEILFVHPFSPGRFSDSDFEVLEVRPSRTVSWRHVLVQALAPATEPETGRVQMLKVWDESGKGATTDPPQAGTFAHGDLRVGSGSVH
jgi:hypothetical protein